MFRVIIFKQNALRVSRSSIVKAMEYLPQVRVTPPTESEDSTAEADSARQSLESGDMADSSQFEEEERIRADQQELLLKQLQEQQKRLEEMMNLHQQNQTKKVRQKPSQKRPAIGPMSEIKPNHYLAEPKPKINRSASVVSLVPDPDRGSDESLRFVYQTEGKKANFLAPKQKVDL